MSCKCPVMNECRRNIWRIPVQQNGLGWLCSTCTLATLMGSLLSVPREKRSYSARVQEPLPLVRRLRFNVAAAVFLLHESKSRFIITLSI